MSFKKILVIFIMISAPSMVFGEKEDKILSLKIGNKDLLDKTMEITAGKIFSAKSGKPVSLSKMISEIGESRFVYVGETHNSLPMHEIQLKVIRDLYNKDKNLSIGLEMFPVTSQEILNKWNLGILSKFEFIRESLWYVNWNFNFGFYEKIFSFAKENRIPMYALNAPKPTITKIRMRGWEALSDEEKRLVPQPDLSLEEHRMLIRTIFETTEIPHQMKGKGLDMMFEGLYRAQSAWDEVMAYNAILNARRDSSNMVVLAGSGHLLYNLGINYRAYEKSNLPFRTVICVEIPKENGSFRVSRSLADYVWGIEEEKRAAFPLIGLRFKKFDGLDNLVIEGNPIEGIAKNSDFKKGDIVLAVDGKAFYDINELRIYLARFQWGDEVRFCLLREAQEKEIILRFHSPGEE